MEGFIVTWDVDSGDQRQCARLRFFVFGKTVVAAGRAYRYRGFVEEAGVRYLGQSVLFVTRAKLNQLRSFFVREGVSHVVCEATVGAILR